MSPILCDTEQSTNTHPGLNEMNCTQQIGVYEIAETGRVIGCLATRGRRTRAFQGGNGHGRPFERPLIR